MTRRPLLAASVSAALCVAASLALLFGGRTGLVSALFNAETSNAGSAFAGGWVASATGPAATVVGPDVSLSWTPGTPGVAQQQLSWADNGTSSSCGSPAWTALGSTLAAGTGSAVDAGRGAGATNGHYVCYRVESRNGSWNAFASFPAIRVGFFATSVSLLNGNTTLDTGDSFRFVFNQPPAVPSSTVVCTFASPNNAILIGDTSSCTNGSSFALALQLTSGSLSTSSTAYRVSYSVSGNTLTATISSAPNGNGNKTKATSPAWSFVPGNAVSATGSAALCSTTPTCTPTPSGSF